MKNTSSITIKAIFATVLLLISLISPNILKAIKMPFDGLNFNRSFSNPLKLTGISKKIKVNADNVEVIGDNLIISGNVIIKYNNLSVHAEKAIVNQKTKDLEASGDVELVQESVTYANMPFMQYLKAKKDFRSQIKVLNFTTSASGQKSVHCIIRKRSNYFLADKVSGNLNSGTLKFSNFRAKFNTFAATAASAERYANGAIELHEVDLTTCDYADDHQEHYSVSADTAKIFPYPQKTYGFKDYNPDIGDHSIWA